MLRLFLILILSSCLFAPAQAQLRGHGGPVRALAVSADGGTVLSGSFDSSAIRWSLQRNAAEQVLRFHDSAVNAVAVLPDGRSLTAGEDGRIAVWKPGAAQPDSVLQGHSGPIVALAISPDGKSFASASWDRSVRVWSLNGEGNGAAPRVLEGHQDNVNGVAFMPDGRPVSAGYDASLRIWPVTGDGAPTVAMLPTALNNVAVAPDGEIIVGGADGKVYLVGANGNVLGSIEAGDTPIVTVALSRDGTMIAAAGIRGAVAIVDRKTRALARTLVGPGLPVWSAAFLPDNRTLVTGGADRLVRRWNAVTGEALGAVPVAATDDPLARFAGDKGAEVFRACVACHTLTPNEGNRAGPTLHGIFGRKIATLPGYAFSEALTKMDIVWTPETVARLFEVGPAAYTPGTKMPEQRITSREDRDALMRFLAKATR